MFFKILRVLEGVFLYTGVLLGALFFLLILLWVFATPVDGAWKAEWARTAPPQKERRDLAAEADDLFRALVRAGGT